MGFDSVFGRLDVLLDKVGERSPTLKKLIKYSSASAVATLAYGVVLVVAHDVVGAPEMTSHLTAVVLSAIPNYLINRAWTWHQEGPNRLWGEVVPFWAMSILGAILSIIFVSFVETNWSEATWALFAANLSAFGVLWIAKFLVLDKLMWKVVHEIHPEVDLEPAATTE